MTPTGPVIAGEHVEITCDDGFRAKPLGDEGSVTPECHFNMDYSPGVECVARCVGGQARV